MATESAKPIEVPLQCLFQGCTNEGTLLVYPSSSGYGITAAGDWIFYALGFPTSARNLGVCKEHQHVTLPPNEGQPQLEVDVRPEAHGVYYCIREGGALLGKATFPTNTLALQFAPVPGGVSDRLREAGRRVALAFGFLPDAAA
jgi:hypothetical protein